MGYFYADEETLSHGLFGWEKKDHKYKSRYKDKKGKWRYIYDKAKSTSKSISNKISEQSKSIAKRTAVNSGGLLNALKEVGQNAIDKIGDTFDRDYDHVLDIFDGDTSAVLVKNITTPANRSEYRHYNRQFVREADRGDVNIYEWESASGKLNNLEEQYKKDSNLKNPNVRTYKYVARIKMNNGKYRYFYTTEDLQRFYNNHPEYRPEGSEHLPLKEAPMTQEDDMTEINKNYDPVGIEPGWAMNCYDCTLAYDARRRGFDVEAIYDPNGATDAEISDLYEGGLDYDYHYVTSPKQSSKECKADILSKTEDGDYGQFLVYWNDGGGHSMVWENDNGKVIIRDCQSNELYDVEDIFKYTYEYTWVQTNDKEISPEAYKKYLQPADDDNEVSDKDNWKYVDEDFNNVYTLYNKYSDLSLATIDEINEGIYTGGKKR